MELFPYEIIDEPGCASRNYGLISCKVEIYADSSDAMIPRRRAEYYLSIGELAEEYALAGEDAGQFVNAILNAFWQGMLDDYTRLATGVRPLIDRRRMLAAMMHDGGDHPTIVFSDEPSPDEVLEDGSIVVDIRTEVILAQNTSTWTDNAVERACRQMQSKTIWDLSSDSRVGFKCQFIGAYELLCVCLKLGAAPPEFWKHWLGGQAAATRGSIERLHRQAQFANWLSIELHKEPCWGRTKESLREAAKNDFEIGRVIFNSVWRQIAPLAVKKGGRPKGSKNTKCSS